MQRDSKRFRARKLWLGFHLYLGLTIGFAFVLLGITGSLLVFYIDIDEWLHPELVLTDQQRMQDSVSYEQIFSALITAHPQRQHNWRIEIPDSRERMITARYYQPEEKADLAFAPLQVWVNPNTAEVISSRFWGEYAMTWIYDLHFTLLMDLTGRNLVASIGACVFLLLITGLYLWWPKRKKLGAALSYNCRGSFQRKIFDLHNVTGFYGLLLLLVIVITGILLDFSATKSVIKTLSPLYQPEKTTSAWQQHAQRISVDKAVHIAQVRFPTAKVKWIDTPDGELGSYRINLRQAGEPSLRFPKTNVWIDQYTGKILAVRDVNKDSGGDVFLRWLHPLHSGEAFGLAGRVVVCLCGLLPLLLFATGIIRWSRRKRS